MQQQQGQLLRGITTVESCTVPGCEVDLSQLSGYHRRHRVCNVHLKTPQVELNGQLCRFCQQCGRFQPLADFQDSRRSCKAALRAHNERRRQNTIASDTALASTRFRSSSSSSSRRALLGSTSERINASSPRRHLARSATLRSSTYDAEGFGALRRTASNPENCRKLRSSSQQSQEAWPGNYSFSDGACHLQQQQQAQPYSMADSPTTSSGSTAGHQQQLNAIPRAKAHVQQRPGKARVPQQVPHGGFMLPQQQQQVLHMAYGHQHRSDGWSGGYQPPAAVAQLDALQLLQATAQPAAGAAAGASIVPQYHQMGMGSMQRQGSQFMPEFYTDTMLDWAQQTDNMSAHQLQQQQGLSSEGLPAASLLPGWQQQQQQQQFDTCMEELCPSEMLPTRQPQPKQMQQGLPGAQGKGLAATSMPPAWQEKPLQQQQPQKQPQPPQFVPKRHGLTAAQLKAIWDRQQQADARMQQSTGLLKQGAGIGLSAGLPPTCAGMDNGAGLPPNCAGMGQSAGLPPTCTGMGQSAGMPAACPGMKLSAGMPGWPAQADMLPVQPQQQPGGPAWPAQTSTPLLLPSAQLQQQSTLSSAGWPVADMQPISTGGMGQDNPLQAPVCSPMETFCQEPQLLSGASTLSMHAQHVTSAQRRTGTLDVLFSPPGQQQLQGTAQDMCVLTTQGVPVQQTYAQVSDAICAAPAQQMEMSSGMCAPMPQQQAQCMSMQASNGAMGAPALQQQAQELSMQACSASMRAAPAQQQQQLGMSTGMCVPARQQQNVSISMPACGAMHAVQTQQQQQLQLSGGMYAPQQQLQGMSMQALGAMHAASAQDQQQLGLSTSMCAPMPQQQMQNPSMQVSGGLYAAPAQQQQRLGMSSGMCASMQQQVQDMSMLVAEAMHTLPAQQQQLAASCGRCAPLPAQEQLNLQMFPGQLGMPTKQEAPDPVEIQQFGLSSGLCVSAQQQQLGACNAHVPASTALYAHSVQEHLPMSGAMCGPAPQEQLQAHASAASFPPQQHQASSPHNSAESPQTDLDMSGMHAEQQWNAQASTSVLNLLPAQLGPGSMQAMAGIHLPCQQGFHTADASKDAPVVTYTQHISQSPHSAAASEPAGDCVTAGGDAPADTEPLAVTLPAAAQGTQDGAADGCLSPGMGLLACIEAEGAAEDISSEQIDALLEHAFSDFLGAGHVQEQADAEAADAFELPTCAAAAAPADIQSSTADPLAWASVPSQQQ